MSEQLARAQLLMAQQRYDLAEKELRRLIGEQPDEAMAYSCLAICIAEDEKRYDQATQAAEQAVRLEPDESYCYYALSLVLFQRNMYKEALQHIINAIQIDPEDADYYGHQASVYFEMRRWQDALDASEVGLQMDPEHTLCNNLRSIALERLGRGEDAVESARRSIKHNPDDSYSHAALGWALLERERYLEAQESFREALRLQPNNEMARAGMIDAINSHNWLFRMMQRWHLSMSRLAHQYQFGIIFGAWLLVTLLGRFASDVPWLAPLVPFIFMAYMTFAVLTWTSQAIFNTLLRFHPFGKHLLNGKEIWTSNCVAACLISAVFGGGYATLIVGISGALVVVFYWMLMCVPATLPFGMPTNQRAWLAGAAGIAIGLIPVYGIFAANASGMLVDFISSLKTFNWSIIGLQVVGGIMSVAPNRM